jgi:hypothetical protein
MVTPVRPIWLTLASAAALVNAVASAADSSTSSTNPTAGAGIWLLLLCAAARKRAVGGWLLYYYLQLYAGAIVTVVMLPSGLHGLRPDAWQDSGSYIAYLVSYVPATAAYFATLLVGTVLLFRRNEKMVVRMRMVLAALVGTTLLALVIDIVKFQDSVASIFDFWTSVLSAIWLAYFTKSVRVRKVFIDRNWQYQTPAPMSRAEKRYRARRMLLWAAGTFIVILVGEAFLVGDKPPDAQLFLPPVAYAILAMIIGWFGPIRGSKRRSFGQPVAAADGVVMENTSRA